MIGFGNETHAPLEGQSGLARIYSHYGQPAPQAYQNAAPQAAFNRQPFGAGRLAGFVGALGSGQQPPGFAAWKDARMAMGQPFTGPQFQQQPASAGQAMNSGYGSPGGMGFGARFGLPRSY